MVLFDGVFGVIAFAVWIFCIIDVITTPADRVRNLPKMIWLLLVVLLADIGAIAWLVAGRAWNARTPVRAGARATNPDDDEEFLASLRARAEEQRRRAREEGQGEPPA
jgi:phospholipase D-like protein